MAVTWEATKPKHILFTPADRETVRLGRVVSIDPRRTDDGKLLDVTIVSIDLDLKNWLAENDKGRMLVTYEIPGAHRLEAPDDFGLLRLAYFHVSWAEREYARLVLVFHPVE